MTLENLKERIGPIEFTMTLPDAVGREHSVNLTVGTVVGLESAASILERVITDIVRKNLSYRLDQIGLKLSDENLIYNAYGDALYRFTRSKWNKETREIELRFEVHTYEKETVNEKFEKRFNTAAAETGRSGPRTPAPAI